ncbi:MAG TPA: hypothetical protein VHB70_07955 [Parafilimonas sp.]|nr:hypothetical protein [Parafilimonas sp.]
MSLWLRFLLICFVISLVQSSYAQDSITIDYLLDKIETQQLKRNDFFIEGVFPSYIHASRKFNTKKKDNTIFYNTLVTYVLKDNYNQFSQEQKIIVDSIIARGKRASKYFKNKTRNTYNFWRTDTATKFHYSWWLPIFEGKNSLPDDMDDTVLGLLMNDENKNSAKALHQLMQAYINNKPPLKTTYKVYQNDSAYSTWFGKKFPVVFDVSVLCNVLSFVQENNLPWTKADSASLQHIVETIQRNDIVKHPAFVSPYYANTSIILYHLARLMSIKRIPELENIKTQLIQIANDELQSTNNIFEKVMLGSALIKWNEQPPQLDISINDFKKIEQNDLPFFIGNIPSYFHRSLKGKFIDLRLLMYNHYCPAWNDCLLLEYLLLSKNSKVKIEK